jgi:hypothetical protein
MLSLFAADYVKNGSVYYATRLSIPPDLPRDTWMDRKQSTSPLLRRVFLAGISNVLCFGTYNIPPRDNNLIVTVEKCKKEFRLEFHQGNYVLV